MARGLQCFLVLLLITLVFGTKGEKEAQNGKVLATGSTLLKTLSELTGKIGKIETNAQETRQKIFEQFSKFNKKLSNLQASLDDRSYNPGRNLFLIVSKKGFYNMTLSEGKTACEAQGATIATYDQLYAAYELGMNLCNCGWLADGTARYPHHWPSKHCGTGTPGIRTCSWRHHWNVYCYRRGYSGSSEINA